MLSQKEIAFLRYWETHREKEGRWTYQLLRGLPLGFCFGLPILVCFIFREWYKWLPFISPGDVLFILIAVVCIVLFYSIFRQKYLWDRKEQQYLEFRARQDRETNVPI